MNRSIVRHLYLSSRPREPPPPTATWSEVPTDTVVLELREFAGPPVIAEPGPETKFPLSWVEATPQSDGSGFDARRLAFQHALRSLAFVAHDGTAASAPDRDAVDRVISSVRPTPVPDHGVHLGSYVAGALAGFPIGTATRVGIGTPRDPFSMFVVRGRQSVFALTVPPASASGRPTRRGSRSGGTSRRTPSRVGRHRSCSRTTVARCS